MVKGTRVELRAGEEFLAKIDDWRRRQPDLPPRAEAIRRLAEIALSTEAKTKRSPKE